MAEREGFPTDDRGSSKTPVKQGIPGKSGEGLRPPLCTITLARKAVFLGRFRGVSRRPRRAGACRWHVQSGRLRRQNRRRTEIKFSSYQITGPTSRTRASAFFLAFRFAGRSTRDIAGAFADHGVLPIPLCADTVAKVENRTTPKISRKSIFRHRYCCKAFYGRYEDRWSFLCETTWSLTSPRTKRIGGL